MTCNTAAGVGTHSSALQIQDRSSLPGSGAPLQRTEPRQLCHVWTCKQQLDHHEGGVLTVMKMSADMAPTKTTNRACLMAMMAAMMKVSSPTSVTRICRQPGGQVQPVPARPL